MHSCPHTHTGLAGSNDIENAQIWGFVDETTDLLTKVYKPFFEKDEAKKVYIYIYTQCSHSYYSLLFVG